MPGMARIGFSASLIAVTASGQRMRPAGRYLIIEIDGIATIGQLQSSS
jgi:hypothetical protein